MANQNLTGIPYFKQYKWSDLTRDERFFCSILFSHAIKDPADFAKWVIETSGLKISTAGRWDVGFEVCFYRDMLWHMGDSAHNCDLPPKRTFDLCLFGEKVIVVIEAKVFEPFYPKQNDDFEKDNKFIRQVPGLDKIDVRVVGLASSTYFENSETYGREDTLNVFVGRHISWKQAFDRYGDELLMQANNLYKTKARKLLMKDDGRQLE